MKYLLLFIGMAVACPFVNAQKIGHLNYGNLLEGLSQVKAGDESLKVFQDSLGEALSAQQKALETRIAESKVKYEAGELTQVAADQLNASLNQDQQRLLEAQQKAEAAVQLRRRQMLEPILTRINVIIDAYGREKGYSFILDQSSGFIMHNPDSEDLTEIIRAIAEE